MLAIVITQCRLSIESHDIYIFTTKPLLSTHCSGHAGGHQYPSPCLEIYDPRGCLARLTSDARRLLFPISGTVVDR